jgi:EAL domain-containing protein (putative c-di-GMP-specific phosphodiesterase class I)
VVAASVGVIAECFEDEELPTRRPPRSTPIPAPGARLRVLVADDDQLVCRAVERILKSQGFGVATVSDGTSAVNALMSGAFDVILSDVCMPGTSGTDLMRVLQAYDVKVPVVLMTGQPGTEVADEAKELGVVAYLRKPVAPAALRRTLEAAVRGFAKPVETVSLEKPTVAVRMRDASGTAVERAIDSLYLEFQPVVSVRSTRVISYEVVVRHGEPAFATTEELMAAAEGVGRAQDLCRKIRLLLASAVAHAPQRALLMLDIGFHDIVDPELATETSPLAQHAKRIVFSIQHSPRMAQIADLEARVHILKFMGFRVAVDDMSGEGSGLNSLAALEPDFVKLDPAVVRDLPSSMVKKRIVRTLMTLCDGLDINVIAEGVESADERDCLRQLGCDFMQGSYFSRPHKVFPLTSWT